jgi:hypothetical protein
MTLKSKVKLAKVEVVNASAGPAKDFPHYYKSVEGLKFVDVYRVLDLFAVFHPALQHAIKKLLVCGRRGGKDSIKDVQEAIAALQRYLDMRAEDEKRLPF